MAKGKRGVVDDDDYEDYGDDDYYDDYYDDGEQETEPDSVVVPHKPAAAAVAPAAAAARSSAKAVAVAAQQQQSQFPVVPAPPAVNASGAAGREPFRFNTPSPDECHKPPGFQGRPVGITLPKAPTTGKVPHRSQPGGAATAGSASAAGAAFSSQAAGEFSGLSLRDKDSAEAGPQSAASAAAEARRASVHNRRRIADYTPEPELVKAVAAASAVQQQAAGAGGSARQGLHLLVMGHVDAGKSTLMGRLLHDLGLVTKKEAHKNERESAQAGKASFSWAWVLDERPEERQRGVTVDVAVSRFQTDRFNVTLLDAPGHRDFVPNMITGAAQADAALLLVDGSPGGFEAGFQSGSGGDSGGQTREHAQLARSLGVEQIAVVVSKLDMCGYSQQRFEEIRGQLQPFLRSCGFRDAALQWLVAVGPSGENLTRPPREPELAAWFRGPTVVQAIDRMKARPRDTDKPLRLPVADVFKGKLGGTCVGGKLEGGVLLPGSRVLVMPAQQLATVKALEVHGAAVPTACAGENVDVTLTGVDSNQLTVGSVLCHPEYPVALASRLEARVVVLDVVTPILRGHQVTLHAHAAREAGRIAALTSVLDAKSGEVVKSGPRCVLKNQTAVVEVVPDRPLCLEEYSDYKSLGRLALRDLGRTIAVGIVTRILE